MQDESSEKNNISESSEISVDVLTDSLKNASIETKCLKTSEVPQPDSSTERTVPETNAENPEADSTVSGDADALGCKVCSKFC